MYQLRLHPKTENDTAPGNFLWEVVNTSPDGDTPSERVVMGGGHDDLSQAAQDGAEALRRVMSAAHPNPVRHEFDCSCGALLTIEARRSRQNPYGWDSPREIMCSCGRVFGVKLQFATGTAEPHLEALYRTRNNVSPD